MCDILNLAVCVKTTPQHHRSQVYNPSSLVAGLLNALIQRVRPDEIASHGKNGCLYNFPQVQTIITIITLSPLRESTSSPKLRPEPLTRTCQMSDILHSPYGLSVRRNGSCLSTETDCGSTWSSFHACCPHGTVCLSGQDNVKCCPSDADCSKLIKNTHCANSTANVYKANMYFCCADGSSAFMQKNGYVGCTEDISELDDSSTLLSIRYNGM